jgi:hypothetical protein
VTEIPQEAIDVATAALRQTTIRLCETWTRDELEAGTVDVIEAALPFLRSQWEQDALSDAAVERLRWHANALSLDAITADDARELLRAALGEEA